MRIISAILLWVSGWKIKGSFPADIKKCVIISAPHTSGWDFFYGRIGTYYLRVTHLKFMIKKEMFKFPLGGLLKALGAIPVDRKANNNTIIAIDKMFNENENFRLIITPEGTRKLNKNWKKGFYHIALSAKVPIVMSYVDYRKKEGGIGPVLYPTGNYEEDFKIITDFYKTKTAKYPENYNLSPQHQK
ncbi:MAG TPA: 1-acyl-sn-glycerol-3-phosphate acyltransferase [Bacteroidales bacterium]|nr:1-acyl-sn-glycerol-3-phosphate acyltransferase [Bacteroidales bacterium]HPS17981.1 1-acyl-sn-glycerol-3-phosphate acyltransferase [Bacteroidales bacterium]